MITEPRYYIFYQRNSYTSSTILFWYVLSTKMKTTNGNKKIQHVFKRPQKYLKFDLRYSLPKYGKISTLKIFFFFSFRLYIKMFEIFSFLLIPNMSYFKEISILLLVSCFHGIAHRLLGFKWIDCQNLPLPRTWQLNQGGGAHSTRLPQGFQQGVVSI